MCQCISKWQEPTNRHAAAPPPKQTRVFTLFSHTFPLCLPIFLTCSYDPSIWGHIKESFFLIFGGLGEGYERREYKELADFKISACIQFLSHSFLCDFLCFCMYPFWLNVCILVCLLKSPLSRKLTVQWSHLWIFYIQMCFPMFL